MAIGVHHTVQYVLVTITNIVMSKVGLDCDHKRTGKREKMKQHKLVNKAGRDNHRCAVL